MWNERGGWGFVRCPGARAPGGRPATVTTLHVHCTAGNLNCDLSTGTPLQAAAMTSAPVVAPSWVIPPDKVIFDEDIVVGDLLGEGSFGAVHKAHHQGAVCVLKVSHCATSTTRTWHYHRPGCVTVGLCMGFCVWVSMRSCVRAVSPVTCRCCQWPGAGCHSADSLDS